MNNSSNRLPWYLKGFWIFIIGIFTGGIYWFIGIAIRLSKSHRRRNPDLHILHNSNSTSLKLPKFQKPKSALTLFGIIVSILWTILILIMHSSIPEEQGKDDGVFWGVMLILFWIAILAIKMATVGIKKLINKMFMRDSNGNSTVEETTFVPPVQNNIINPIIEDIPEPITEPIVEEPQLPVYDTMEGHAFEYYCADLLRKDGFSNVEVTQGSGDQGIDILAEKGGIKYGIQCKCYSNNIGNSAVQQVFAGKTYYHCHVAAVLTNRYFTRSAKQLAEENQVLLWDRDELERLVRNFEN